MNADFKLVETFRSEEGTVRVYDNGLVESIINEGAYIDVPYIVNGKRALEKLGLDKKFYVINSSKGFYRTSREARTLSASKEYSEHIGAVAVLTSHVSTKFIIDLYLKLDKPYTPTKAFSDKRMALAWILERMSQDRELGCTG